MVVTMALKTLKSVGHQLIINLKIIETITRKGIIQGKCLKHIYYNFKMANSTRRCNNTQKIALFKLLNKPYF